MKRLLFSVLFLSIFLGCNNKEKKETPKNKKTNEFAIVIHGGAGTILKENMSPEKEKAYKEVLKKSVSTGYEILKNGGSSTNAVVEAIKIMEDSPLFNAGKGAVFTHHETNELDASIMKGNDLNAGAVAGVTNVKNPIELAKKIMEDSPHVMLSGSGASVFAKEKGLEIVDPKYFYTENRFQSLQRVKEKMKAELDHNGKTAFYDPEIKNSKYGTVGCVALDKNGNITAGTSTGGMTNKRWNRIGDSPIIGAGTYAKNTTCGVSSTGWGEYFIRLGVALDISNLMEYKNSSLQEAANEVIQHKLTQLGGTGGIIAIDKNGNIVYNFNTAGMYRASMNDKGKLDIKIYKE